MKLTRYTPSFDLGRVADFDQWLRNPFAGCPTVGQFFNDFVTAGQSSRLATDVHEDKDNFYARFELPGIKKEDVKVEVHDRLLTVSADRREKEGESESALSMSRSISVPEGIRGDAISAKLEDGILTVTLPKQEHRKPKLIEIT
ncbi:MAG TPA: Hsp20/alpha crystallin family protein [Prosthecobacter sp.]|nr:Hsp20/alpha crystallin family protein [Prosthecobacter sp.]